MKTKLPGLLAGAALITFVATPAFAQTPADLKVGIDTVWVLLTAALVFFMNLGFALVESADVPVEEHRQHPLEELHRLRHLQPGLLHLRVGADVWKRQRVRRDRGPVRARRRRQQPRHRRRVRRRLQGDCLDRRSAEREVLLPARLRRHRGDDRVGSVAERIKYFSFIVFSFLLVSFVYPITGHWIWGGGWLATAGFWDFAGSTVVHSVGGWAALAGILVLGPRLGKYGPDGKVNAIPPHSYTSAVIGCFVLWLGWFGFNPGSTMAVDANAISHIFMTTNTAGIMALLSATATELDLGRQAVSRHVDQRMSRGPRRDHGALRVCDGQCVAAHRLRSRAFWSCSR